MPMKADQDDFQRLFPDARPVERGFSFRTFRYGRREFDRASPDDREDNCRKAMKFAYYTAAYFWLLPAAGAGMPGAILLSFRSNVVVDALGAILLALATAAFALGINRFRRAGAVYPGRVRATWAGMVPPRLPDDE